MIVVNLFAGPGAGKSTMMAEVFSRLKHRGVNVEMAPEFAKELVWEGRDTAIGCQPYIFGKQYFRLHRLKKAGLEVAITDSPLLLSCVYGLGHLPESFLHGIATLVSEFDNLNFFVERMKPYDPRGRLQTEAQARELDFDMKKVAGEKAIVIGGDNIGARTVAGWVLRRLRPSP